MLNTSKIYSLIKENKISQEKLASKIGMSRNGLNKSLKSGDIKLSTLKKIADQFDMDIFSFFNTGNSQSNSIKQAKVINANVVKSKAKVLIEIDLNDDEILRLGIKEKVLQILSK